MVNCLNDALSYAQRGWYLLPVYGVSQPEVCTCWKGRACPSPGKHPSGGDSWHLSATTDEDEISSWFESNSHTNIGLLLGPKSGVIDVELDGEEAEQAWAALNLGEVYTPTYRAGRGPHRLFRWSPDMPTVQVRKPLGIEVRIGGGGRAAQSILPPSRHHSGVQYEWVPGLSPDDVELAEIPERLMALLWNDDGSGQLGRGVSRPPTREVLHRHLAPGERNSELHRFAVAEAFRCGAAMDDEQEQQDLLLKLRAVNTIQCQPPLDDGEVIAIYRSAVSYVRRTRAAGITESAAMASAAVSTPSAAAAVPNGWQRVFTAVGLSYGPLVPGSGSDPEWGPGEWALTVVHSDPLEYRLHVPAWRQHTADGTGDVMLSVDQFRSAAKTAAAVLGATGVVMLDDEPKRWRRLWDGGYKVVDARDSDGKATRSHQARGVKAKLLDCAGHEQPGASSLRYCLLAQWLYERLSQASEPSEDDCPDPAGRAAWRADGSLWFSWSRVWEDVSRQHRLDEGERLRLKARLLARMGGERDWVHREFRHAGGTRRSYVVWTRHQFAVLEAMATTERINTAVPSV